MLSEYGMTTRSIYIGLELSEHLEENVIKENMKIATGSTSYLKKKKVSS